MKVEGLAYNKGRCFIEFENSNEARSVFINIFEVIIFMIGC
jgi:hypothetical protein